MTTALSAYKAGVTAASRGKKKSRRRARISLAMIMGALPYAATIYDGFKVQGVDGAIKRATKAVGYDGYTKTWSTTWIRQSGIAGLAAGAALHWVANRFGWNRMFRKLPVCI